MEEEQEEKLNENGEADQTPNLPTGRSTIKYENEGELGGSGPRIPPEVFPPEQWVENGGLVRSWDFLLPSPTLFVCLSHYVL